MKDHKIQQLLERYQTITVVGLSRNPTKDSHRVARYLKSKGNRIIHINPFADQVLIETCYPSLLDTPLRIQRKIVIVDIFRPSHDVPPIVDQAIQLKQKHRTPDVIWMQLGIINDEAALRAVKAGFTVVMDKCLMAEHIRLIGSQSKN
jgi:predicted CoA-binding protein